MQSLIKTFYLLFTARLFAAAAIAQTRGPAVADTSTAGAALYIGFKCWDEKDKIRASVAKRDTVINKDNVRVWLDTYNDQRRAYVLAFNPLVQLEPQFERNSRTFLYEPHTSSAKASSN